MKNEHKYVFTISAQVLILQNFYIRKIDRTITSKCGGTLINHNTVLSAAHCISTKIDYNGATYSAINFKYPTLESTFKIILGAHDVSFMETNSQPGIGVVISNVSKVIQHELFNGNYLLNDISLFILEKNITPNAYINVACLPEPSVTFPGYNEPVIVSGWVWIEVDLLKMNIYNLRVFNLI